MISRSRSRSRRCAKSQVFSAAHARISLLPEREREERKSPSLACGSHKCQLWSCCALFSRLLCISSASPWMAGGVRGRGAEEQGQGLDSTRTRRCHYYRLRFSHWLWLWLWLCVNFIIMVFLSFFLFLFSTFSPFLLFCFSTAVAACTKVSISNVALTYDGLPRIVIDQLEFLNWFQFRSRI